MVDWIKLPGLVDYATADKMMEDRVSNIINQDQGEAVYLVEHNDVYTAGTSYDPKELLSHENIPVIYTSRGGKFTYHGPGQRVIYPVLNLSNRQKDIRLYVRDLENWMIDSLAHFGVKAMTFPGKVGIWVNTSENKLAKIGAIGIRVRKWVAYHGIAVNVSTNLDKYCGIIPCGIHDFPVTSLHELGIKIDLQEFDDILKIEFDKIFV